MKKRIISALFMLAIFVPIIIAGGKVFNIAVGLIAILTLKEVIDLKNSHSKIPSGIVLFSMLSLLFLVFYEYYGHISSLGISHRLIIVIIIGLLFPTLFSESKEYLTKDAFYLLGFIIFFGICFNSLIVLREESLEIIIYLLLITVLTDTFALLVGTLLGKHKLAPKISPAKTIEGALGGLFFATSFGSLYYLFRINSENILLIIIMSFCLSITASFGDLIFSKIKRENNIKDFSKLIPGHGGLLDRLDSFLFVILIYFLFIKII